MNSNNHAIQRDTCAYDRAKIELKRWTLDPSYSPMHIPISYFYSCPYRAKQKNNQPGGGGGRAHRTGGNTVHELHILPKDRQHYTIDTACILTTTGTRKIAALGYAHINTELCFVQLCNGGRCLTPPLKVYRMNVHTSRPRAFIPPKLNTWCRQANLIIGRWHRSSHSPTNKPTPEGKVDPD